MVGKLREKRLVAKDTYEVTFSFPEKISFQPGQYVTVSVPRPRHEDYQMNERIFSLVNSPTQNDVAKILFRYRESGFKKNLIEMVVGTEVEIEEPIGMFQLPKEETTPLVFLATGVGVAPFMSVLSFLREQKSQRHITFFLANYSPETAIYLDALKEISNDLYNLRLVIVMTRDDKWTGERQRVSVKMVKKYVPEFTKACFFLAGLPEFVDDLVKQLLLSDIPRGEILQESFDGY